MSNKESGWLVCHMGGNRGFLPSIFTLPQQTQKSAGVETIAFWWHWQWKGKPVFSCDLGLWWVRTSVLPLMQVTTTSFPIVVISSTEVRDTGELQGDLRRVLVPELIGFKMFKELYCWGDSCRLAAMDKWNDKYLEWRTVKSWCLDKQNCLNVSLDAYLYFRCVIGVFFWFCYT